MKPIYIRRDRDGNPIGEPVPYEPLLVLCGTYIHKLALHKDDSGQWIVGHPPSGGKVTRVDSTYASSRGLGLTRARRLAMARIDDLIEEVGSDAFNRIMSRKA
jgi:hypothetical protein